MERRDPLSASAPPSAPGLPAAELARARARHAEVFGDGPRVPTADRRSIAEPVTAATARLRGGMFGEVPMMPLDAIPQIMFTLHPFQELWDRVMALSTQMQGASGKLAPRDRQLAILRTAWLLQAPFEWGEHARISKTHGVSAEEIARVIEGSAAEGWDDHDRAILRAAEELRAGAMIGDDTWEQLAQRLSPYQLFELCVLIGHYSTVAYFQNALRLELDRGNEGLIAR
ncbi:MAG: carboxymuconolactone decarboxylase family protein [Novosphingobium sp.]